MSSARWFSSLHRATDPELTLICFHYAGGNAGVFRPWGSSRLGNVDLLAVNLPGRASRFNEVLIDRMDVVVDRLIEAMIREQVPGGNRRFAFFGHSMGGLIAFELARRLEARSGMVPDRLIVSGSRAPSLPRKDVLRHTLPKAEFIAELRRYGGTPEEVLQHEELLETLAPILRADFAIGETYRPVPGAQVQCPMTVFGGASDPYVESALLDAWQGHAAKPIDIHRFAGGHFFLQECEKEVLAALGSILGRVDAAVAR